MVVVEITLVAISVSPNINREREGETNHSTKHT